MIMMTKIRPSWRKSSYSNSSSNCVEVGQAGPQVAVRDTRDRTGPALAFSQQGWREFTRRIRSGQGRLLAAQRGARHVRERPFAVPAYRQPNSHRIGHGTSLRQTYRRSLRPLIGR